MEKIIILKIANILSFIICMFFNYFGASGNLNTCLGKLGGRRIGAVSDTLPVLIVPAGYAFSIWAVIYSLIGAFVIY